MYNSLIGSQSSDVGLLDDLQEDGKSDYPADSPHNSPPGLSDEAQEQNRVGEATEGEQSHVPDKHWQLRLHIHCVQDRCQDEQGNVLQVVQKSSEQISA